MNRALTNPHICLESDCTHDQGKPSVRWALITWSFFLRLTRWNEWDKRIIYISIKLLNVTSPRHRRQHAWNFKYKCSVNSTFWYHKKFRKFPVANCVSRSCREGSSCRWCWIFIQKLHFSDTSSDHEQKKWHGLKLQKSFLGSKKNFDSNKTGDCLFFKNRNNAFQVNFDAGKSTVLLPLQELPLQHGDLEERKKEGRVPEKLERPVLSS